MKKIFLLLLLLVVPSSAYAELKAVAGANVSNVTGTLPTANGGTGATNAGDASKNLQLPVPASSCGGTFYPTWCPQATPAVCGTATAATSAATLTTSGSPSVLTFSAVPAGVKIGMLVADSTTSGVLPPLATVSSVGATTVTLTNPVIGAGVGSGDTIAFSGPSWCTGTDIGAWISAASYYLYSNNYWGKITVDFNQSPYTKTTTAYVDPFVSLDCQNSLFNESSTSAVGIVSTSISATTGYTPGVIANCREKDPSGYSAGHTDIGFYAGADPQAIITPQGNYSNGVTWENDHAVGMKTGFTYGNNAFKETLNDGTFLSGGYDGIYDPPVLIGFISAYSISSNVLTLTFSSTAAGTIASGDQVYVTGTGVAALDNKYFKATGTPTQTSMTAAISAANASGSVGGLATDGCINCGEEMVAENITLANMANGGMDLNSNAHRWSISNSSLDFNATAITGTQMYVTSSGNNYEGNTSTCPINLNSTSLVSWFTDTGSLFNQHNSSTMSGWVCSLNASNVVNLFSPSFQNQSTVTQYVYTNTLSSAKIDIVNPVQQSGTAPTKYSDATTYVAAESPINITPASIGLQLGGVNGIVYPSVDSTANGSIGIGSGALANIGTTSEAFGATAVGYQALNGAFGTTQLQVTGVGFQALKAGTTAEYSTALGYKALTADTTGSGNTAAGNQALQSVTTGANNTAVGNVSGYANVTGVNNVYVGDNIDTNNFGGTASASYNSALGSNALYTNSTGGNNVAVGYKALYANTTGANNTAVGYQAMDTITTGVNNVAVGYNAETNAATDTNEIVIGASVTGNGTNTITIGNSTNSGVYIQGVASNTGAQSGYLCYNSSTKLLTYDGTNTCLVSSLRYKNPVAEISDGLSKVIEMRPVIYTYKDTKTYGTQLMAGFYAEDMDKIDHTLVEYEADGVTPHSERPEATLAYAVRAIQQQQAEINDLKSHIGGHRCYGIFWCED